MATTAEIQTAYKAIYRVDLNATTAAAIAGSGISLDNYIAAQLPQVASTTQAGVAITAFITGTTPTSAKLDELKVAADAQVASYAALKVADPALGAYEAFGKGLATDPTTTAGFNTKYGALSNTDFINNVYASVYGTTPSAGAFANLSAQLTSFTALYTANNVANAALAAKGAVLGQIVGYAFVSAASASSLLDNQVQAVLTSAAKGDATVYAAKLPVVVDPGQVGVTITLSGGDDVVSGSAADPAFKSTTGNDTINGLLQVADRIDAGNGDDTGNFTFAGANVIAAGGLVSVESLKLTSTALGSIDLGLATGVKSIAITDSVGANTVSNIAAGVALSVTDTTSASATEAVTFTLKDATGTSDSVALAVNGVAGAGASIAIAGVETISLNATGVASTFALGDTALKSLNITAAKNVGLTLNATALESVVATGAGGVDVGAIGGTALKTVDASGLTGTTGFTAAIANGNAIETFKLSGGADSVALTTTEKALAVDLGAGNDTLTYTQTNTNAGAALGAVVAGAGTDSVTLVSTGSAAGAAVTQKVTLGAGSDSLTLTDVGNVVTTIVYSGSDSTLSFLDTINGFKSGVAATATAGADKIDLTAYALGSVTLAQPAVALPAGDSAGLFTGASANVLVYDTGATDLTLLIDSNKDGTYTFGTDLAIKLTGIATASDITTANFVV